MGMRRSIRLTFFAKNLITALISTLVIGLVLTFSAVWIGQKLMTQNLYDQAKGVAAMALKQLQPEDIESAAQAPSSDSTQQSRLRDELSSVSDANENVAQVYIFDSQYTDGKSRIIAMPAHLVEAGLIPGEYYENPAAVRRAIDRVNETKQAAETEIYSDAYGDWITIVEPVIDGQGEVYAVLGMDMNADMIGENRKTILSNAIIVLLISLAVVILAQFLLTKRTLAPVRELFGAIDRVSRGNLDIELRTDRKDDFGELNRKFADMVKELRSLIGGVQHKAGLAASSSTELSNNVRQSKERHDRNAGIIREVAAGAGLQDQSANETARVMEEMARGIQNIAESAGRMSDAAVQMTQEAFSGQTSIQKVVGQMAAIDRAVNRSSEMIATLDERTRQIAAMVDTISGIASQTNLLALNAAIEASRAGDHGKGFSVVAAEVRALADMSARSAAQISDEIRQIRQEAAQAVLLMKEGVGEVNEGARLTGETNEVFQRIMTVIQSVSAQTEEMSAVTEQMSASSEEVSASVLELATIAKASATGAANMAEDVERERGQLEAMAESAERLKIMSEELYQLAAKFEV